MRSNLMIAVVVCGLAASLGLFFMLSANSPPAPQAAPVLTEAAQPGPAVDAETPATVTAVPAPPPAAVPHSIDQPDAETPEQRQEAYVDTRSAELMDLAMNDDSDSLNTILSELANRDPKIRQAAVEASIQFHSRDAIPRLQDAALQTEDGKERAAIQDAIEFLKLPTITEVLAEQARQAAAAGTNAAPAK